MRLRCGTLIASFSRMGKSQIQSWVQILAVITLPFLGLGCGNPGMTSTSHLSIDSSGSFVSGGGSSDSGFRCPSSPNVLPSDPYSAASGIGEYVACQKVDSAGTIRLKGAPRSTGQRVCAFPAKVYDDVTGGRVVPKLQGAIAFSFCGTPIAERLDFGFAHDLDYNAVYVVDEAQRLEMQSCLTSGNRWSCPSAHSYGRFRQ
jgi:hypothetical protein